MLQNTHKIALNCLVDLQVYYFDNWYTMTKSGLPFRYPGLPCQIFGLRCQNIAKQPKILSLLLVYLCENTTLDLSDGTLLTTWY